MILITRDEVRNILSFLEERYPNTFDCVESLKRAAPPQVNPNGLLKHLFFCLEEGFIDCTPIEENGQFIDFGDIRINSSGIRYIKGF